MKQQVQHAKFGRKLVIVGFGSIGQGLLPLLFRHIEVTPQQVSIVTADERGREVAEHFGVRFVRATLNPENLHSTLVPRLSEGDFLVNLSVDVSSVELVRLCHEQGALYIDTCTEPWPGAYIDDSVPPAQRSNYILRESMLSLRRALGTGPTALVAHGANPGLVSHFIKQALLNIASDTTGAVTPPAGQAGWAALAHALGIRAIHIAERDSQTSPVPKAVDEFVNTWSIDGFVAEGCQPAELGWGTHEKALPPDGQLMDYGTAQGVILMRPGASVRVRSWAPLEGPFHGFLITHNEAISTNDYFTVRENGQPVYRPTVNYAYHPSDEAVLSVHELAGKNWRQQSHQRLMMDEIESGTDELGVLLMGHAKNAYWFGSRLSIGEARELAPFNNATSLQVAAAVLSGMVWVMENPARGIVEAEETDFRRQLEICTPYLGKLLGAYTDWTPLTDRSLLFPETLDEADPWQFSNIRVN